MLFQCRTDIASESFRQLGSHSKQLTEKQGVAARDEELFGLKLFSVEILNQEGARALGKPEGKYFTLSLPRRFERGAEQFSDAVKALADLITRCGGKADHVLVAALGNPDITPDALGSLAAGSIIVTRHLKAAAPQEFSAFSSLALSRPGVLGSSGIESAQQIQLLCQALKPQLVIVIDALAGSDLDGLCRCIQISNTGISPGSGVGNDRQALNREGLGVPVLSIGMPTVIDAGSIGGDSMQSMFVTPRDIDIQVRSASRLIGYGINLAVHSGISIEDIDMLVG